MDIDSEQLCKNPYCPSMTAYPLHFHGDFRLRDGTPNAVFHHPSPPKECTSCHFDTQPLYLHHTQWDGPYKLVHVHREIWSRGETTAEVAADKYAWQHQCGGWSIT